jgi:hypothetical protein
MPSSALQPLAARLQGGGARQAASRASRRASACSDDVARELSGGWRLRWRRCRPWRSASRAVAAARCCPLLCRLLLLPAAAHCCAGCCCCPLLPATAHCLHIADNPFPPFPLCAATDDLQQHTPQRQQHTPQRQQQQQQLTPLSKAGWAQSLALQLPDLPGTPTSAGAGGAESPASSPQPTPQIATLQSLTGLLTPNKKRNLLQKLTSSTKSWMRSLSSLSAKKPQAAAAAAGADHPHHPHHTHHPHTHHQVLQHQHQHHAPPKHSLTMGTAPIRQHQRPQPAPEPQLPPVEEQQQAQQQQQQAWRPSDDSSELSAQETPRVQSLAMGMGVGPPGSMFSGSRVPSSTSPYVPRSLMTSLTSTASPKQASPLNRTCPCPHLPLCARVRPLLHRTALPARPHLALPAAPADSRQPCPPPRRRPAPPFSRPAPAA